MKLYLFTSVVLLIWFQNAWSQDHQHEHAKMSDESEMSPVDDFLMKQTSGTSSNPGSSPMHMKMMHKRDWMLMWHGQFFLNYTAESGPRGDDQLFSTNWFMGMAERPLGPGHLMLRSMISLEPATITDRSYPLLFQTGETAYGEPLVDAQHPHDFFMELAAQYAYAFSDSTLVHVYYAPVGAPALGPVGYPHRISAMELPQAPLSHHLQDSSHIAVNVLTGGIRRGPLQLQVSGFHGREPDEFRWNLDWGSIDSWATRIELSPKPNWNAQFSIGRLKKPEELEPGDIVRATASVTFVKLRPEGFWATSFIWGHNHKVLEDRDLSSYLLESLYQFRSRNYLTARFESVDKDELFTDSTFSGDIFRINAFSVGYSRDFPAMKGLQTGVGGNVTFYAKPDSLNPFYGDHPKSVYVYFRIRPVEEHPMTAGHH